MIFSRRKPMQEKDVPILVQEAPSEPTYFSAVAAGALEERRRRADTDGTRRRARQTKQDNELL